MIQASELRIGNWVEYNGHPIQVRGTAEAGNGIYLKDIVFSVDKVTPIPINKVLLEKIGATPSNDNFGGYLVELSYVAASIRISRDEKGYNWYSHCNYVRVDNLHQLQNLYFALTGTELKINL